MRIISIVILLFFLLNCTSENINNKKVAIQPFENFDPKITDSIAEVIKSTYKMDVTILPKINLPSNAFINIKSARYRADSLIKYLKYSKAGNYDYILGLTDKDISTTKRNNDGSIKEPQSKYKDWGIFGLGYRPGPSCVVSSYRIKKNVTQEKYLERIRKVVLHELGHNFGLPHCESGLPCVMQDAAESIKTVDNAPYHVCNECKNEL